MYVGSIVSSPSSGRIYRPFASLIAILREAHTPRFWEFLINLKFFKSVYFFICSTLLSVEQSSTQIISILL